MKDHLYAIASTTRKVKFGRSRDVRARLGELQVGSPEPLRVVAVAAGDGALESELKWQLRLHQLHGEWFSVEILTTIERAIARNTFGDVARRLIAQPPVVRDRAALRRHRTRLREARVATWKVQRGGRGAVRLGPAGRSMAPRGGDRQGRHGKTRRG